MKDVYESTKFVKITHRKQSGVTVNFGSSDLPSLDPVRVLVLVFDTWAKVGP